MSLEKKTNDWENELNSTLLDSSAENGGVCTNQPGDAAGGSARPCAPTSSRSTNELVSRAEYNRLALKIDTVALETKNNTSDIKRLDSRVCDTEQEIARRHNWTEDEDDNLSRLVIENGTQDWDKIKNLCREVGIYLTRQQIKRHYYQLLAERELTKHRDLSDEKRTFLVMERLKLPSNDNKKLSTRIAEEHSIKMSCQEIANFLSSIFTRARKANKDDLSCQQKLAYYNQLMGTQLSLEDMIALIDLSQPKPKTIVVADADNVSVLGGCTDSNVQPESSKMASDSSRGTTNTTALTNSTSERSSASGKATSSSSGGAGAAPGIADYTGHREEEDAESESDYLSESGSNDDTLQPLRQQQPQQRRLSSDSESTATDLRSYGPGVALDDKKYPLVSEVSRPTTAISSISSKPKSRDEMTREEIQAELKKISAARAKCHFSERTAYIKKEDKLRELLSKKRGVRKPLRPINRRR